MKIKTSLLIYMLFLLPYFVSSQIMSNGVIWTIRFIGIFVFLLIFINLIMKKKNYDCIDFLIFLIPIWLFAISIYRHTINIEISYLVYSWFAVCFISYNCLIKENTEFLKAFTYLLNISVIINIPFLIKGIGLDPYYRVFLFGGKNQMQMFFLPAIFCNYALSIVKYGKIKVSYLFFIILDIITIIMCGSTTGILAIMLFLFLINFRKLIKINIYIYIIILIIALVLIFNTEYILKFNFLKYIIVDVLHKDLTFTARTKIWNYIFPYIMKNPIGYGYGNELVEREFLNLSECHNMFLELLTIGGIPLLILFSLLVFKLLNKNPNKNTNALLIICFSFFVIGLSESVQFHLQFWVTMIFYYKISNNIIKLNNKKKNKKTVGNMSIEK